MSYQRSRLEVDPESGSGSDSENREHGDIDNELTLEQIPLPPLVSQKTKTFSEDETQLSPQKFCCCCNAFFSTKFAFITITLTLLTILCITVTLDLTILELERESRYRYYGNYDSDFESDDWNENNSSTSLIVRGTKDFYEKYYYSRTLSKLKYIEFDFMEVPSTKDFLYNLDHANRLETLILTNIKFNGRLPYIQQKRSRPKLGSLQDYVLSINEPIGPTHKLFLDYCDNCLKDNSTASFDSLSDPACLRHLIFFEKYSTNFYETGDILSLKTNISIWIWGYNYFTLNYKKGEITTMLNYTDDLLRNISSNTNGGFKLETLKIKETLVDGYTLERFSTTLKNLHLDSIKLTNTTLSQLLPKFTKLEHLTIKIMEYTNYYDSTLWDRLSVSSNIYGYLNQLPRTVIDLANLPTTLMNLTLSDVELIYTNSSTNTTLLNFNLDQLVLHHVNIMNPNIINDFPKLFRVKRVGFQLWDNRKAPQGRRVPEFTWRKVLHKLAASGATWVYMDNTFVGEVGYHQDSGESGEVPLLLPDTKRFVLDKMNHPSFWEEEIISTPEDGKLLWFTLLNMETFVNKHLALSGTW